MKRPTNRTTIEFGFACVPPAGSCDVTMPSRGGVVGVLELDAGAEARVLERRLRDRHVLARDVGTADVVGPPRRRASRSLRSGPRSSAGSWSTTMPAVWSEATSTA